MLFLKLMANIDDLRLRNVVYPPLHNYDDSRCSTDCPACAFERGEINPYSSDEIEQAVDAAWEKTHDERFMSVFFRLFDLKA